MDTLFLYYLRWRWRRYYQLIKLVATARIFRYQRIDQSSHGNVVFIKYSKFNLELANSIRFCVGHVVAVFVVANFDCNLPPTVLFAWWRIYLFVYEMPPWINWSVDVIVLSIRQRDKALRRMVRGHRLNRPCICHALWTQYYYILHTCTCSECMTMKQYETMPFCPVPTHLRGITLSKYHDRTVPGMVADYSTAPRLVLLLVVIDPTDDLSGWL